MPQDMPPTGGYGPVQYKRNLPAPAFRPSTLLLGVAVICTYGWYKLIKGIREQNELAREKVWSRIHLIPLLQAEEDRDLVRRHLADQAREKELLGENLKVYNKEGRYISFNDTPLRTGLLVTAQFVQQLDFPAMSKRRELVQPSPILLPPVQGREGAQVTYIFWR